MAIKIRGLPFRIGPSPLREQDIENFFAGFNFIRYSVVIGRNPDGRPSGLGTILFRSLNDAEAAIDRLNHQYFPNSNRYVELSIMLYGDYLKFKEPTNM